MATDVPTADLTCAQCGAAFQVPRTRAWNKRKFCGGDCATKAKQAYRPDYIKRHAKRNLAVAMAGTKTCRKCDTEKPVTAFRKSTNYKDGRMSVCAVCQTAYDCGLLEAQPPEQKEARRLAHRERSQAWRKANSDKVKATVRKASAANTERYRKWRVANLERCNAHIKAAKYKRRAKEKGGVGGAETLAWFKARPKVCYWCNSRCAKTATIDHYIPLSKGGAHEIDNLVIACRSCNSRKNAKDPLAFAREVGRLL